MATFTLSASGTLGDHFPLLELGSGLIASGHTVRYAGPSHLRPSVEACGMEFHRARPDDSPEAVRQNPRGFDHWGARPSAPAVPSPRPYFELYAIEDRLADLEAATRGSDLLICSRLNPVARTAAEVVGVPWITICVTPSLYPDPGSSAERGHVRREDPAMRPGPERQLWLDIHAMRARLGLADLSEEPPTRLFESERILLATDPCFGNPGPRQGCQIAQTGFLLHSPPAWRSWQPSPELMRFCGGDKPPLVLSLSSQPVSEPEKLVDLHLEAARQTGHPLVVQSGWAQLDSPSLREAEASGEGIRIESGPHDWLFPRAAAVIHHGGIGTTVRAILAGTPSVVEPFGNDQFYNARQVLALGAGVAMHPHLMTAGSLARALSTRLLTPPARDRVRKLAAKIRPPELARSAAVRQIEEWLSGA